MNEKTRFDSVPQNLEEIGLKPWRTPVVEEIPIDQTELVAGEIGDDGILYTS